LPVVVGTARWEAEYDKGRYVEDPPLPFVAEIVAVLEDEPRLRGGLGSTSAAAMAATTFRSWAPACARPSDNWPHGGPHDGCR
jgi:hypothetical protein